MKMFPTLKELWENTDQKEKKRKENIGKKKGEGNNLSVSDDNKRGKRQSIVSSKYFETTTA